VLGLALPLAGAYASEVTIYAFGGGSDGGNPPCGLISGGKGVVPGKALFYGTTQTGGAGFGTVFQVESKGVETPLYTFSGGSDGAYPVASLIADASGNLYGTTEEGGAFGYGVVFKLTLGGTETVLYTFTGGADGAFPAASLIMDDAGNLFGTAQEGGANGDGVVFEVPSGGGETVLHSFDGSDGAFPVANLVMDKSGVLYSTTAEGGANSLGTVFKLAPGDRESVLHSFAGGSDGAFPVAGLIMDKGGNLYGTTESGGASNDGTVFKVSRKGKETLLYAFAGESDGASPVSAVTRQAGFLFGTTSSGGANDMGAVFKIPVKGGDDTVLFSFTGGRDGGSPRGSVLDMGGNLFGTAYAGGNSGCASDAGCGVVFEVSPK
jgi:uncharacterized repeat protein (TIGR03803 family)